MALSNAMCALFFHGDSIEYADATVKNVWNFRVEESELGTGIQKSNKIVALFELASYFLCCRPMVIEPLSVES